MYDYMCERYCKNDGINYEEYDDSCIIWDSQNGVYHILNKSAMQIFKFCDQCTKEDIIHKMLNVYKENVSADDIANDVELILKDLINKGVIYGVNPN